MIKDLRIMDLGRRSYVPVMELQEKLVEMRKRNEIPDTLVLVEHEPVYTLGRNAKESNIIASAEELKRMSIAVVRTGRGGEATYHGPGQLVGYPIIDISERGQGAIWYIGNLERVIVLVLSDFGVAAGTDKRNRGVWIRRDKIAAIGVRITGNITMHGFALNVSVDLSYYKKIIPCGLPDRGVTSLHLLAPDISLETAKNKTVEKFMDVFGYRRCL